MLLIANCTACDINLLSSVLSALVFAIVVDIDMDNVRNGLMIDADVDDLVLMGKTMGELREKFWKWKD